MPREKEGYRENYEMLLDKFGGKILLNKKEVAKGFQLDVRTASERYPFKNNSISIATLARCLCG